MAAGRPTKYKPEYAEQAQRLCENNAFTDAELAQFFGVTVSTLNLWKAKHPEFSASIHLGKGPANARVAKSLYERAMGYSCVETDIRVINSKIVKTEVVKNYPPDPTALVFFLKNRVPTEWKDKRETEISGQLNYGDMTDEQLERAIAAKEAANASTED